MQNRFGVSYSLSGIRYVFQRLKVKKKTARPTHVHEDEAGEKRFKKVFPHLKQRYSRRIYFEDEMRTGTRTECKQRWAAKARRPACKVKLGYTFTYLYAAIAPATGKLIALLLPDMAKVSFASFVEHFRKQTKVVHGNHKVVLITDGAALHQPDVYENWGIAFEKLPAGCPELNPAERFFK